MKLARLQKKLLTPGLLWSYQNIKICSGDEESDEYDHEETNNDEVYDEGMLNLGGHASSKICVRI